MPIDLRSDTVTLPTAEMRQAMATAAVGDDVFGEDPTVNELEALAARVTGKEAALFVTSGTMGNLGALLAHCQRGQEVILGDESHIYHYENGSASALGGMVMHPVPTNADGTLPLDALEKAIHLPSHNYHFYHWAPPGVICLENTHNRCGGAILSPSYFAEVAALARRHDLPVHLDGARLFNAAVACGPAGDRLDRARVVGAVVPVEGPGRARGLADLRIGGVRGPRAADAEDPRRRHAPGGRDCRARHRGADEDGGPPGGGPREREDPRRRASRSCPASPSISPPSRRTSSSSRCRAWRRPRSCRPRSGMPAC